MRTQLLPTPGALIDISSQVSESIKVKHFTGGLCIQLKTSSCRGKLTVRCVDITDAYRKLQMIFKGNPFYREMLSM